MIEDHRGPGAARPPRAGAWGPRSPKRAPRRGPARRYFDTGEPRYPRRSRTQNRLCKCGFEPRRPYRGKWWAEQEPLAELLTLVYERTNYDTIYSTYGCFSPLNFEGELPDGPYGFWIEARDKAGNYGTSETVYFEVDTVAPKFVSGNPTGRRVSPYADVVVTFDDKVYNSKQFVNIYKGSSNTPLAVYRYYGDGDKKIEVSPKNSLRRDTRYTVKVTTGVTDGANNLEAPKTWSFKTK